MILKAILLASLPILLSAQDVMTIAPAKAIVGSSVTLTYNPKARGATILEPAAPEAQILVFRDKQSPELLEIRLTKSGSVYRSSFTVGEASLALFIQVADGDLLDTNNDLLWNALIYDAKGSPVPGALTSRGQAYLYGRAYNLRHEKDLAKALKDFNEETRLHKDLVAGWTSKWQADLQQSDKESTKEKIRKELDALYPRVAAHQEDVAGLLPWFERTGLKERANTITNEWVVKDPKGIIAVGARWIEVYAEQDRAKRFTLFEKFDTDFPAESKERANRDNTYVSYAIGAKEYDKALRRLQESEQPGAMSYNNIAWQFIEKGERLEDATGWAKKGVEAARRDRSGNKPAYMSTKDWNRNTGYALGMVLDSYGYGLDQLGRTNEAEPAYREAYDLTEGNDPDVAARYVALLLKNKKVDKALDISAEAFRKGRTNDDLTKNYRSAFAAKYGSTQGFEKELEKVRAEARVELKKKLKKEMIDKPSIDFTLKALDGSTVTLSKLRGKVVVLDFWATWCGPCISSFPFLQRVYNTYKENPNIVILAVNTWENEKGDERARVVRAFIEEKKFTFPVVFDDDFVSKYGVEGIPTKFIIDQKGRIRFKDVGFGGGEEMMQKMDLQFEMLLGGDMSER